MTCKNVLVVARTKALGQTLIAVVRGAGHRPTLATSFAAAKPLLDRRPDLLLVEGKLAEYNGLHLGMRAKLLGIPAIVIADRNFERDAQALGVACVPSDNVEELAAATVSALEQPAFETLLSPWPARGLATRGDLTGTPGSTWIQ